MERNYRTQKTLMHKSNLIIFAIVANCLLSGCASTTVSKDRFHTSANMKNVTWSTGDNVTFHAEVIDSSGATNAIWNGPPKVISAAGAAALLLK